jgi:hypothetical protein
MGTSSFLSPYGDGAPIVDKLIGDAYTTVRTVAENLEQVKHISANLAELFRVYGSIDSLDALYGKIGEIDALYADLPALDSLYANQAQLLAVSAKLTQLQAIYTNLTQLLAVYAELANLVPMNTRLTAAETLNTTQTTRLDGIDTLNTTQNGRLTTLENGIANANLTAIAGATAPTATGLSLLSAANAAAVRTISGSLAATDVVDDDAITTPLATKTSSSKSIKAYADTKLVGAAALVVNTQSYDWASLASAGSDSNAFTVTGIALGDVVIGFSVGVAVPAKLTMTAFISAANTITVSRINNTGGAVDLAATNHKFVVLKQNNWGI